MYPRRGEGNRSTYAARPPPGLRSVSGARGRRAGWIHLRLGEPGSAGRGRRRRSDSPASDVDDAVAAATDAQRAWAEVPVPARAEVIAAVGDVVAERKAELANLVSREAGKILVEAGGDVQEAIDMAGSSPARAATPWARPMPCEIPTRSAWTTRHPVGVVGMITPWNFPVAIPSWKIFPAAARRQRRRDQAVRARAAVRRGVRRRPRATPASRTGSSTSCTASASRARRSPRTRASARSASPARCRRAAWSRRRRWPSGRGSCRSSSAARTRWS